MKILECMFSISFRFSHLYFYDTHSPFLSFFLFYFIILAGLRTFICPVWIELFGKIEGQDLFKHLRMRSDERMLFVVRPGKKQSQSTRYLGSMRDCFIVLSIPDLNPRTNIYLDHGLWFAALAQQQPTDPGRYRIFHKHSIIDLT